MDNVKPFHLFSEFLGTFMLQAVYLVRHGDPLAMGFTLAAMAFFSGPISGAYLNPALTLSGLRTNTSTGALIATVAAQVAGAMCADAYVRNYAFSS